MTKEAVTSNLPCLNPTQARSTVIHINRLPSLAAFRIVFSSVQVGHSIMLTFSAYNCAGKGKTKPTFSENPQLIRKRIY